MNETLDRRELLKAGAVGMASALLGPAAGRAQERANRPNVIFVFADQWRAQATGYAGDPNAQTPNVDRLAERSVNFANAVSCCPVCSPYRASLLTGQYPLTHGVFLNDVPLRNEAVSLAEVYRQAGYDTAYIGKWHLDGNRRSAFIPRERRQGFDFWKVLGCTHAYNNSFYYGDEDVRLKWEGYDAIAQTRETQQYIRSHAGGRPFLLVLSWGPPHDPYQTAPQEYRDRLPPEGVVLRPNVPEQDREKARRAAAGYYAHIAALDDCVGDLVETIRQAGIERDTIFVFTSDHGDLLYSHGGQNKQQPYDESIRVPFLLRYPALLGDRGVTIDTPINSPDIMPTLLGLSRIAAPPTVEGTDFSGLLTGGSPAQDNAALIACYAPFGQWTRARGGREYRGVRTHRYTYVRDLDGPWLLFDNQQDPYQLDNLCGRPEHAVLQKDLEALLAERLTQTSDAFLGAADYIGKWGYEVDDTGTVRYTN
ncbi:MAG TPA: sulfatase [Sedimentisphaerales bacterium]|jgi:arylsulfatase A-like enzyme|nr:sulfatase [Sedimentisphaerales bacterium]HNU30150.1 sulfatase [Sedimentisphaerales bacterium]